MKKFFNSRMMMLTAGAVVGMVLAVLLVNSKMEAPHTLKMFDGSVEYIMKDVFQSPPPVTEHGWNVDRMIVFVHVMMGVLFVGWTLYFLACLLKFRKTVHPKAESEGPGKLWSTLAEYVVIVAEVVLIISFAAPLWGEVIDQEEMEKIKIASKKPGGDGLEVHILAKQFDWNARYAGNDGEFAEQDILFANKVDNPFGIDNTDGNNDDVVVLNARERNRAIVVPEDRPIALKITSMDVIHSFKVLPLRVCKDAIPGLQLPIWFEAKGEYLRQTPNLDGEYIYAIQCAQLCGSGHAAMIGYLKVVPQADFDHWLDKESREQKKARAAAGETETVANADR